MNTRKLAGVFLCAFTLNAFSAEKIWLIDDKAWDAAAKTLASLGFDVEGSDSSNGKSGFVLRVTGAINDLSTQRGTPYGGYAVAADLSYKCTLPTGQSVFLQSGIRLGMYSFTGANFSSQQNNAVAAHVDTVSQAIRSNAKDINQFPGMCAKLRQLKTSPK